MIEFVAELAEVLMANRTFTHDIEGVDEIVLQPTPAVKVEIKEGVAPFIEFRVNYPPNTTPCILQLRLIGKVLYAGFSVTEVEVLCGMHVQVVFPRNRMRKVRLDYPL